MSDNVGCYCFRFVTHNNCTVQMCKIVPHENKRHRVSSQIFKTKYYPQMYAVDIERVLTNNLWIIKINKDL